MDHNYHTYEPESQWAGKPVSGIVRFEYVQFSLTKLNAYFSSEHITVSSTRIPMHWWIEIGKENRCNMPTMSFWANCRPVCAETAGDWYCYAELDFRLLPNDRDEECVISWKHTDLFSKSTGAAGFYEFDGWNDIRNPDNGFISNDTITVEVVIKEMITFNIVPDMKPLTGVVSSVVDGVKVTTYDLTGLLAAAGGGDKQSVPDVQLAIGNSMVFKGHRSMLSKSYYLRTKMDRIAASLPPNHTIPLTLRPLDRDADAHALLSVFNLLYNDVLMLDKYNVALVFSIATALRIESVRRACLTVLSPTTVLTVLNNLHNDPDQELFDDCERAFIELSRKAVKSKSFRKVHKSLLKRILVLDELKCKEIHLFEAVVRWCQAECQRTQIEATASNMRQVLGESLYNIRFGHMSMKEFKAGPKKSGILNKTEIRMIKKFIVKKKAKAGFLFPTKGRSPDADPA